MELEFSLILFLVLQSLSVGMISAAYGLSLISSVDQEQSGYQQVMRVSVVGGTAVLIAGLATTLFHLGHPERFLNGLVNFGSSWLAREGVFGIFAVLFSGGYALTWLFDQLVDQRKWLRSLLGGLAVFFGLVMVFSTAMLYVVVRSIPFWNTPVTVLVFFTSCLSLGTLAMAAIVQWVGGSENMKKNSLIMVKWSIGFVLLSLMSNGLLFLHLQTGITHTSIETLSFLLGTNIGTVSLRWLFGFVLPLAMLIYTLIGKQINQSGRKLILTGSFGLLLLGEVMAKVIFFQAAFHV